jgi:cell division protein FtsW
MPRKLAPDIWLFGVAVVLLSAGVVMVYSASAIVAADRFHDPYFFLKKQIFCAARRRLHVDGDPHRLSPARAVVLPLLIFAGVLLVLVLVSPFGQAINGTRRWIRLGPVSFSRRSSPSWRSSCISRRSSRRRAKRSRTSGAGSCRRSPWPGSWRCLVLAQPDLGNVSRSSRSPSRCCSWPAATRATSGLIVLAALPPLAVAIWVAPYRLRRIVAFIDPWSDPRGSGFQIIQSWLAFGNGGIFGQGIGASRQKLFYLPESHTDFIFAIVGEELGLVGALIIVALFVVLIWRGLRIGLRAPDPFGGYLALGITMLIATQVLVNLGVVTGLLPTKGLPLPFISFGGSALLVTMLSTGVLLNISQQAHV